MAFDSLARALEKQDYGDTATTATSRVYEQMLRETKPEDARESPVRQMVPSDYEPPEGERAERTGMGALADAFAGRGYSEMAEAIPKTKTTRGFHGGIERFSDYVSRIDPGAQEVVAEFENPKKRGVRGKDSLIDAVARYMRKNPKSPLWEAFGVSVGKANRTLAKAQVLLPALALGLRKDADAWRRVVWDFDNTLAMVPELTSREEVTEYYGTDENILTQRPSPVLEIFKDQLARGNVVGIVTGRPEYQVPYMRQWLVENGVPEDQVENLEIQARDYESQADFPGIEEVNRSKVADIHKMAPDLLVDDHVESLYEAGLELSRDKAIHPDNLSVQPEQTPPTPPQTPPETQGRNQGVPSYGPQEAPSVAPEETTDAFQGAGTRPQNYSQGGESMFSSEENDPLEQAARILAKGWDPEDPSGSTNVLESLQEQEAQAQEPVGGGENVMSQSEFAQATAEGAFDKATSQGRLSAQQQRTDGEHPEKPQVGSATTLGVEKGEVLDALISMGALAELEEAGREGVSGGYKTLELKPDEDEEVTKMFEHGRFAKQDEEEDLGFPPIDDEADVDAPAPEDAGTEPGGGGDDVGGDLDTVREAADEVENVAQATDSENLPDLLDTLAAVQEVAVNLQAAADAAQMAELTAKKEEGLRKALDEYRRDTAPYPFASNTHIEKRLFEDPDPLES